MATKAIEPRKHDKEQIELAALVSEALRKVKATRRASEAVRRDFLLTPDEEQAALAGMSVRHGLVLRFLLTTGARVSEALGIRLDQCREDGKGGKARELRDDSRLFNAILETFGSSTWLFETRSGRPMDRSYVSRQIPKSVKRTVGKRFSPHCARHTFATRAIERTDKIEAVSAFLGHSSVAVTLSLYTHQTLTDADLDISG